MRSFVTCWVKSNWTPESTIRRTKKFVVIIVVVAAGIGGFMFGRATVDDESERPPVGAAITPSELMACRDGAIALDMPVRARTMYEISARRNTDGAHAMLTRVLTARHQRGLLALSFVVPQFYAPLVESQGSGSDGHTPSSQSPPLVPVAGRHTISVMVRGRVIAKAPVLIHPALPDDPRCAEGRHEGSA